MSRGLQDLFTEVDELFEHVGNVIDRIKRLEWQMRRAESGYIGHTFARKPIATVPSFPKSLREIGLLPPHERYKS